MPGFRCHYLHPGFFARTVLVQNKNLEAAYNSLERILKNEGITETSKRLKYYEKPYQTRQRLCLEKNIRMYDAEMKKKIDFLLRKSRVDPFPR